MAKENKKAYIKPQLKSQKIELGVYGDYDQDGGKDITPSHPVRDKDLGGLDPAS